MCLCVCTEENETLQETLFVCMLDSCAIFAWKTQNMMQKTYQQAPAGFFSAQPPTTLPASRPSSHVVGAVSTQAALGFWCVAACCWPPIKLTWLFC